MPFAAKGIDWDAVRKTYVERPQRPTYDELALEFACAPGSLARLSSEEGWPALRARYMESQMVAADASAVILAAVRADRTILTNVTSLAILMLEKLSRCVESVQDEKAPQTKAQALNTCSFAMKNLTDALKNVGLIGVSKTLDQAGKEGNNQWDPKFLQQINVTVQNLKQQDAQPAATVEASPPEQTPTS